MKLTIFSQHFWPENFRINDVTIKLKSIGINVNVFTGKPNYPSGIIKSKYKSFLPIKEKYKNIDILRFPIYPRGNANFIRLSLNYLSFILSSCFFSFFYKKKFGEFFFIYATSPIFQAFPVLILRKFFKFKVVLWVQDLWPDNLKDTGYINNQHILSIINFFVKKIYNNCDLILCQSDAFVKEIKKKSKSKIKLLYNPSNYKFRYKKKKKSNFFDVYYTGNLGHGQSFDRIFDAFESHILKKEMIRLIIFGSGKNLDVVKRRIKKNKIENIILHKTVPPKKLKNLIQNADCFILKLNNGIGLSKTIPAKFQTYLSFGKPIISINNGIVTQLVKKYKIGFYSKNEKTNNLINVFLKAKYLSVKQTYNISQNCKKLFIDKFEINNTCKKLKKYLEEL